MLPIMGLFAEIYRDRHGETKDLYDVMFSAGATVDDYFPSHFDYATPFGHVVRRPLFGDLPRAIMDRVGRDQGLETSASTYLVPGADARCSTPLGEALSNPRKLGRPRLFRQRTSTRAPDDLDALTATSYASSTRASYVTPTPEHVSSRESSSDSPCCASTGPQLEEQVTSAHLEERASKQSAVVRLASALMLDDPVSP